jgi:hypothetical protein
VSLFLYILNNNIRVKRKCDEKKILGGEPLMVCVDVEKDLNIWKLLVKISQYWNKIRCLVPSKRFYVNLFSSIHISPA